MLPIAVCTAGFLRQLHQGPFIVISFLHLSQRNTTSSPPLAALFEIPSWRCDCWQQVSRSPNVLDTLRRLVKTIIARLLPWHLRTTMTKPEILGITAFRSGPPAFNQWWEWTLIAVIGVSGAIGIFASVWYSYHSLRKVFQVRIKVTVHVRSGC
jgi:hypothetical protein